LLFNYYAPASRSPVASTRSEPGEIALAHANHTGIVESAGNNPPGALPSTTEKPVPRLRASRLPPRRRQRKQTVSSQHFHRISWFLLKSNLRARMQRLDIKDDVFHPLPVP
jgi:hypothetical protein